MFGFFKVMGDANAKRMEGEKGSYGSLFSFQPGWGWQVLGISIIAAIIGVMIYGVFFQ